MASQSRRLAAAALAAITLVQAVPATASYLYWVKPSFAGEPVRGDEPGIGITIPKATPKELQAHLLWNMRAGLNVAALQCQFSPSLMTVRNYNDILRHHGVPVGALYFSPPTGSNLAAVAQWAEEVHSNLVLTKRSDTNAIRAAGMTTSETKGSASALPSRPNGLKVWK